MIAAILQYTLVKTTTTLSPSIGKSFDILVRLCRIIFLNQELYRVYLVAYRFTCLVAFLLTDILIFNTYTCMTFIRCLSRTSLQHTKAEVQHISITHSPPVFYYANTKRIQHKTLQYPHLPRNPFWNEKCRKNAKAWYRTSHTVGVVLGATCGVAGIW